MNNEVKSIVEDMITQVQDLNAGYIDDVDRIWEKHYDSIATSVECSGEEECHRQIAEIRSSFYEKADEVASFQCDYCGDDFYGKPYMFQGEEHCENCLDEHKDDYHDA